MKYIAIITFFTILLNCIFSSIFALIREFDWSIEWIGGNFYYGAVIFIFPIFVIVIIFKLSKKLMIIKSVSLKYALQLLMMFVIIQGSFICFATLDLAYRDFNYECTIPNIIDSYRSNYLVYALNSFSIPISIIFLDKWYCRRFILNKNAIVSADKSNSENNS